MMMGENGQIESGTCLQMPVLTIRTLTDGQFCTTGPSIFTWWDLGGMVIQVINMGGINPTVCHPNPRPTTLTFVWHINTSVPKTNSECFIFWWDWEG